MSSRELRIFYTGDARGVFGALKQIESAHATLGDKMRAVGQRITSAGKSLTVGLTLPVVAFGTAAVKAFGEAEKVTAQTEAVLKSTGGAAGVTAKQVATLATRIQNYSGLSDEAVASSENLLLTFTNIRNAAGKNNDIFNQATAVAADLSVALGQDLKTSAIQVGKALNDPTVGLTALRRVGVSFSDSQVTMIQRMFETGRVMEAQKIILAELTKEFGGSARAVGETAAGQWQIAKERIGNAMETIGRVIVEVGLPIFEKLASALQTALNWFNALPDGTKHTIIAITAVAAGIGPLLIVIGKLVSAFGVVAKAFTALSALLSANPYVLLIAATVAIVALVIKNWDTIKEFLRKVWDAIVEAAKFFWDKLAVFIIGPMKFVIDFLIDHWRGFRDVFLGIWDAIRDGLRAIVGPVLSIIRSIVSAVQGLIGWIQDAIEWLGRLSLGSGTKAGDVGPRGPVGGSGLAHGGIVRRPTLALLGEAGPEAVIPLGASGMPGLIVNVVNNGTLIGTSPAQLAELLADDMRRAFLKSGRRNLNIFGGLA